MGKLKPFKEGCPNKWISFGMEKKQIRIFPSHHTEKWNENGSLTLKCIPIKLLAWSNLFFN